MKVANKFSFLSFFLLHQLFEKWHAFYIFSKFESGLVKFQGWRVSCGQWLLDLTAWHENESRCALAFAQCSLASFILKANFPKLRKHQ